MVTTVLLPNDVCHKKIFANKLDYLNINCQDSIIKPLQNSSSIATKNTLEVFKSNVEEEVAIWLLKKSKPLISEDILTLKNFFENNSLYTTIEEKTLTNHLLNIITNEKINKIDHNFVQFEIYESFVFVQIDLGIIQFSQYTVNNYVYQFYRYQYQWYHQKIYDHNNTICIYQMCKKIHPKLCDQCQKYIFDLSMPPDMTDTCVNCNYDHNGTNYYDEYVEVNPNTIKINKVENKNHNINHHNAQFKAIVNDKKISKDKNMKFYSVDYIIEKEYIDCKKNIENKRYTFSKKNNFDIIKQYFSNEISKQKIHLTIEPDELYSYQVLNNLCSVIFYHNNVINYYRHRYNQSYHYIMYKNDNKIIICVIDDPENLQKFDLTDFSSVKSTNIMSESFRCLNVTSSNVHLKYFFYYEEINGKIFYRKTIAQKKDLNNDQNYNAEIIFDVLLIKNKKDTVCTVAACDEPENLTIFKNIYQIQDNQLFYKKIMTDFKFHYTLSIITKTSEKKFIYKFDKDFNMIKKKIKYSDKKFNNQLYLYLKNRSFVLYYKNKNVHKYLRDHNAESQSSENKFLKYTLPMRGNLEINNIRFDIYNYRMSIYYEKYLLFVFDYKKNHKFLAPKSVETTDILKELGKEEIKLLFDECKLRWPSFMHEYNNAMEIIKKLEYFYHEYEYDDPIRRLAMEINTAPLITINNDTGIIINNGTCITINNDTDITTRIKYVHYNEETKINLLELGLFQQIKKIIVEKAQDLNITFCSTKEYEPNGFQKNNNINNKKQNNTNVNITKLNLSNEICQVGYKACKTIYNNPCIVKLGIYHESDVVYSARYDKYRTNKAYVMDILNVNGNIFNPEIMTAYSFIYEGNISFQYRLHETVTVLDFDNNIENDCGRGIHYHNDIADVKQWFNYTLKDLYHEKKTRIRIGNNEYDKIEYVPIFNLEEFDYVVDGKKFNNLYAPGFNPINQKKIQKNKLIYCIRQHLLQKNIYHSYTVMHIYQKIKRLVSLVDLIKNDEIKSEIDKILETDIDLINFYTTSNYNINTSEILDQDAFDYLSELDGEISSNITITEVNDDGIPMSDNLDNKNSNITITEVNDEIDIIPLENSGISFENFELEFPVNNLHDNLDYTEDQYEIDYLYQIEQTLQNSLIQINNNNTNEEINESYKKENKNNLDEKNEEIDESYKKENINNPSEKICVICFDEIICNYVLVPCGHTKICGNCIPRLNNCPICRKRINQYIKFYD